MNYQKLKNKIISKWTKIRLAPIHVFCLHHVSACFNHSTMIEGDWMELKQFKQCIMNLQKSYTFISLVEAQEYLKNNFFRWRKYAVLTFDDGWESLKEILPWLIEQNIPVTLFLNPQYMDGKHYRNRVTERYLTRDEVQQFIANSNGLIKIGMHGIEHFDVSKMNTSDFKAYFCKSLVSTKAIDHESFIPFWAYTWGRHNVMTDEILKEKRIVPVYMDGMKNYIDANCIHRELLECYK